MLSDERDERRTLTIRRKDNAMIQAGHEAVDGLQFLSFAPNVALLQPSRYAVGRNVKKAVFQVNIPT